MKSKIALVVVLAVVVFGVFMFYMKSSLTGSALSVEWMENQFPEKLDEDTILPYGYTLGSWPQNFEGEPIVTKLTYQKGPPEKFLEKITQVWRPVEIELEIYGPKTIKKGMGVSQWKGCFGSAFACHSEKEYFISEVFPDQSKHKEDIVQLTWFDSLDPLAPRGIHLKVEAKTYQIDRYVFITDSGATQTFSMQSVKTPEGERARDLFAKTISGLKVKEDIQSARSWIQNKISSVNLDQVRLIPEAKLRLERLIQIQTWIYSLLTVDPRHIEPFFHLAGVTHMLAIELLRSNETYFKSQEAWILSYRPLFETLLRYTKDFPGNEAITQNIESLLQDVLYELNRISH